MLVLRMFVWNRKVMVDYDLRALEQYVLGFSDDEDMEELLILKYGGWKNLLAEAAALRRLS